MHEDPIILLYFKKQQASSDDDSKISVNLAKKLPSLIKGIPGFYIQEGGNRNVITSFFKDFKILLKPISLRRSVSTRVGHKKKNLSQFIFE